MRRGEWIPKRRVRRRGTRWVGKEGDASGGAVGRFDQ
jgi:hypothetical protein